MSAPDYEWDSDRHRTLEYRSSHADAADHAGMLNGLSLQLARNIALMLGALACVTLFLFLGIGSAALLARSLFWTGFNLSTTGWVGLLGALCPMSLWAAGYLIDSIK